MPDSTQAPKDLMGFLDFYLVRKAPFQIPAEGKEWIVKYGPWITLVLLILFLPRLLLVLGIGTPFAGVPYATGFGLAAVLLIVELGLMVAALSGLFARRMSGWTLLFYSRIVSFVASLLMGAIVNGLVSALISMYILFQVRPLYRT
jgi:hypothetical protein